MDLGNISQPVIRQDKSTADLRLKEGEVSEPVKTQFGWHVIKVEDVRVRKVPPYEKVKAQMRREVWEQLGQDFLRQYREQAKVERFSFDGKTKLPKLPPGMTASPSAVAKPK